LSQQFLIQIVTVVPVVFEYVYTGSALLDEIAAATANAAAAAPTIVPVVTPAVAAPDALAPLAVEPEEDEVLELFCCAIAICETAKLKTNRTEKNLLNIHASQKKRVSSKKLTYKPLC